MGYEITDSEKTLYDLCGIYRVSLNYVRFSLGRDLTIPDNMDMAIRSMKAFSSVGTQLKAFVMGMG